MTGIDDDDSTHSQLTKFSTMCDLLFPLFKMALKARIFDDYQCDPHKNAKHACCQTTDINLICRMYITLRTNKTFIMYIQLRDNFHICTVHLDIYLLTYSMEQSPA